MSVTTMMAAGVQAGPVGRDDPGQASRADRLVVASLGKLSEGGLLDIVQQYEGQPGAWAEWICGVAVARLERDYGYGAIVVDERALGAAGE